MYWPTRIAVKDAGYARRADAAPTESYCRECMRSTALLVWRRTLLSAAVDDEIAFDLNVFDLLPCDGYALVEQLQSQQRRIRVSAPLMKHSLLS